MVITTGGLWAQQAEDNSKDNVVVKESSYAVSMRDYLDMLNGKSDKQLFDLSQKKITRLEDLSKEEIEAMINDENSTVSKTILAKRLKEINAEQPAEVKKRRDRIWHSPEKRRTQTYR